MTADPNSPQAVASLLTEQEAAAIVGHLDSLGIEAHIWGNQLGSTAWPEVPTNVQVVVRQADVARAKEALEQFRR